MVRYYIFIASLGAIVISLVVVGFIIVGNPISQRDKMIEQSKINPYSHKVILPTPKPTIPPSLIGEWNFEEGKGDTASDTSGNGNTGTLVNGPMWTTGKKDNALSFNGVNNYVGIGSLGISDESKPFTLEAWVKVNDYSNYPQIIANGDGSVSNINNFHINLSFYNDGRILLETGKAQVWDTGKFTTSSFSTGVWYYVVATYDGSKTLSGEKIYVNGVEQSTTNYGADSGAWSIPYDVWKIGSATPPAAFFNGTIGDVRIYNYARTPAQIVSDYNR
jgi:hypothetical protein